MIFDEEKIKIFVFFSLVIDRPLTCSTTVRLTTRHLLRSQVFDLLFDNQIFALLVWLEYCGDCSLNFSYYAVVFVPTTILKFNFHLHVYGTVYRVLVIQTLPFFDEIRVDSVLWLPEFRNIDIWNLVIVVQLSVHFSWRRNFADMNEYMIGFKIGPNQWKVFAIVLKIVQFGSSRILTIR